MLKKIKKEIIEEEFSLKAPNKNFVLLNEYYNPFQMLRASYDYLYYNKNMNDNHYIISPEYKINLKDRFINRTFFKFKINEKEKIKKFSFNNIVNNFIVRTLP